MDERERMEVRPTGELRHWLTMNHSRQETRWLVTFPLAQWSDPPSRMQFSSRLYAAGTDLAQQNGESSREVVQITRRPIGPRFPDC